MARSIADVIHAFGCLFCVFPMLQFVVCRFYKRHDTYSDHRINPDDEIVTLFL